MENGDLKRDSKDAAIQSSVRDPAKQQIPFALSAASKVFKVGPGADFDITGWLAVCVTPSTTNLTNCWFNDDTTKTFTVFGGQENWILLHSSTSKLTINGTDARVEVGGM